MTVDQLTGSKPVKFGLFVTPWGWVGIAGTQNCVHTIVLPLPSPEQVIDRLSNMLGSDLFRDQSLFAPTGRKLQRYFSGEPIPNWDVSVDLTPYPAFTRRVLKYTATIPYGNTQTYAGVAAATGNPRAARAVGQALKRNPCPILIPCHRVIARHGTGGFTAPGGVLVKQALLALESKAGSQGATHPQPPGPDAIIG